MAEDSAFRHISVVPAEEEEIVIQAGARRAVAPAAEVPVEAPVAEVAAPAPLSGLEATLAAAVAPAEDRAVAFAAADAAVDADAKAEAQLAAAESGAHNLSWALHSAIAEERAANPRPREAYRETTLEDLESAPMSKMQKIILFVLLGMLVAFGVYCLLRFGLHLF